MVAAGQAELMTEPMPDLQRPLRWRAARSIGSPRSYPGMTALVVGPGIGVNNGTHELIALAGRQSGQIVTAAGDRCRRTQRARRARSSAAQALCAAGDPDASSGRDGAPAGKLNRRGQCGSNLQRRPARSDDRRARAAQGDSLGYRGAARRAMYQFEWQSRHGDGGDGRHIVGDASAR